MLNRLIEETRSSSDDMDIMERFGELRKHEMATEWFSFSLAPYKRLAQHKEFNAHSSHFSSSKRDVLAKKLFYQQPSSVASSQTPRRDKRSPTSTAREASARPFALRPTLRSLRLGVLRPSPAATCLETRLEL